MSKKPVSAPMAGGASKERSLADLQLDALNPRFGFLEGKLRTQSAVLDHIVDKFGIDDVLSSLSVNGYFEAEPMVCRIGDRGKAVVIEGNRRLAACLILAGDPRASRHANRTQEAQKVWKQHGQKKIDPVPVIEFAAKTSSTELLSYLGVRHIAGSQPWDSYAKAAWIAKVVADGELSLEDVTAMIGDQYRTTERLLEGYYFVNQLIDEGKFVPENSQRRGRGSVSEYPFSWVYTLLGYSATRSFLDLDAAKDRSKPLAKKNLAKAALVTSAMFGDKSKGQSAAIDDSRELGNLAAALADPEKVTLLEQGKTIAQIDRVTQPLEERLRRGLATIREIQSDLIAGLSEQTIPVSVASGFLRAAGMNRQSAGALEKKLQEISNGDDE